MKRKDVVEKKKKSMTERKERNTVKEEKKERQTDRRTLQKRRRIKTGQAGAKERNKKEKRQMNAEEKCECLEGPSMSLV